MMKPYAVTQLPKFVLTAIFAGAAILLTASLLAQETPVGGQVAPAADDASSGLTLAEVEAALAAIEADTGIEDAVKDSLRPKYQQAIEALKQAADFEAQTADYREAIKTTPEKAAALRDELKVLPSAESATEVTLSDSSDELQKTINSRRAALNELNDGLSKITSEIARVKKRPIAISSRLPETQRELSDIRQKLASPTFAEDPTSPSRVADRILMQAAQSRLMAESAMLEQ
jgi:chromosome segregation ATPase